MHRHPKLKRPITRVRVEAELADLWNRSGIPGGYSVVWPKRLARRHEKSPRSYAQVQPELPPTFEFAPQLVELPPKNRTALLAHEIGHVLTPQGSEDDADQAAEITLGVPIAYDLRWPGKGLQTVGRANAQLELFAPEVRTDRGQWKQRKPPAPPSRQELMDKYGQGLLAPEEADPYELEELALHGSSMDDATGVVERCPYCGRDPREFVDLEGVNAREMVGGCCCYPYCQALGEFLAEAGPEEVMAWTEQTYGHLVSAEHPIAKVTGEWKTQKRRGEWQELGEVEEPHRLVYQIRAEVVGVSEDKAQRAKEKQFVADYISAHHAHFPKAETTMVYGVIAYNGPDVIGVAKIEAPNARELNKRNALEVNRVAIDRGLMNWMTQDASSAIYAAAWKEARNPTGYRKAKKDQPVERLLTYTIEGEETGESIAAAGFEPAYWGRGGEWGSDERPREKGEEHQTKPKIRWQKAKKGRQQIVEVVKRLKHWDLVRTADGSVVTTLALRYPRPMYQGDEPRTTWNKMPPVVKTGKDLAQLLKFHKMKPRKFAQVAQVDLEMIEASLSDPKAKLSKELLAQIDAANGPVVWVQIKKKGSKAGVKRKGKPGRWRKGRGEPQLLEAPIRAGQSRWNPWTEDGEWQPYPDMSRIPSEDTVSAFSKDLAELAEKRATARGVETPETVTGFDQRTLDIEPDVVYFASGSNHPGEIQGLADLAVPGSSLGVGVAADVCVLKKGISGCEQALAGLAGTGIPVFVDSGAFSEVKFGKEDGIPYWPKPITHKEWERRLALYLRLGSVLGPQLYAVAPDRVADQVGTLERMTRYADVVKQLQAMGVNILAPIQKGDLSMANFYREVVGVLGHPIIAAIPMKADATTYAQFREFLEEVGPELIGIHLLGLGPGGKLASGERGVRSARAKEVTALARELAPQARITQDSVLIRKSVGWGDTGSLKVFPVILTHAQHLADIDLHDAKYGNYEAPLWDPNLGEWSVVPDRDEALLDPSFWIPRRKARELGERWGLSESEMKSWLADPESFLSDDSDGYPIWESRPDISLDIEDAFAKYVEKRLVATRKRLGFLYAFSVPGSPEAEELAFWEAAPIVGEQLTMFNPQSRRMVARRENMGKAAYDRGSASISRGIRRDFGFSDPGDYLPAPVVPRPPNWGGKAYEKALKFSEGLLRYARTTDLVYSDEDLMWLTTDKYRSIGKKTALAAAREALRTTGRENPMYLNPSCSRDGSTGTQLPDGFCDLTGELGDKDPEKAWISRCHADVVNVLNRGQGTAKEIAKEAGCSVATARTILNKLVKSYGAKSWTEEVLVKGGREKKFKIYQADAAVNALEDWIAYREDLELARRQEVRGPEISEDPTPWDWREARDFVIEIEVDAPAEVSDPFGEGTIEGSSEPFRISAWVRGFDYPVGYVELYPNAEVIQDTRMFGRGHGSLSYAPIANLRVHPAFRREDVGTMLVQTAGQIAEKEWGLPVASSDARSPGQAAFWRRQVKAKKASKIRHRSKKHPEASRYLLKFPPPKKLANPDFGDAFWWQNPVIDPTTHPVISEATYPALFTDSDGDGIYDVDDPYPMVPGTESIEEVRLSDEVRHLIEDRRKFDDSRIKLVKKLRRFSPSGEIKSRTKTPYSIINKLRRRRLLGPKGLTDVVGAMLVADTRHELEGIVARIYAGELGKVIEHEDFYAQPRAGYRAHHFVLLVAGVPVELQLKTKRLSRIAAIAHEPYKHGTLDGTVMLEVTETADRADQGDSYAATEIDGLLASPGDLETLLTLSGRENPLDRLRWWRS